MSNATVTVTGTATDKSGVGRVEYRLENVAGTNDYQPATGTNQWSAEIGGLAPGLNTVRVRAFDTSSNASATVARSFNYLVLSPFTLNVTGEGVVLPDLNGQLLRVGAIYKVTARAGAGSIFSDWAGVSGANGPSLTFVMRSNLVLEAYFVPNRFPFVRGSYAGLLRGAGGAAFENSAWFTASVSPGGRFSAKTLLAGKSYHLSGQFSADGAYSNAVPRRGLSPLEVGLQLDLGGADEIKVAVSDGRFMAQGMAHRATFSRQNPAAPGGQRYTMVIPPAAPSDSVPGGYGYGTLSVDVSGTLRFAGTLGDGTKASQGAFLSKSNKWPMFVSLYRGMGSLLGWMAVEDAALTGQIDWFKLPQPGAKYYPSGFTLTNAAPAVGSVYSYTRGAPALTLTNGGAAILAGGDLDPALTNYFLLDARNRVRSADGLSAAIAPRTGLFRGKVVNPATHRVTAFAGALVQSQNAGWGYALGSTQVGQVYFGPPPSPPPPPTVTVIATDASAAENGSSPATFTITRTTPFGPELTVRYALGGTAINGTDYALLSGTVTLPPGSAAATVSVHPIDDTDVEGNETVVLTLVADPAYEIGSPASATVTITDNDVPPPLPVVSIVANTPNASETGPTPGAFTISRTDSTAESLIVRYAVGGTAANGADYATLSGSATIAAGSSAVTVSVLPVDDALQEGNETVVLTLSANPGYTVGSPNSGAVTIADNDSPPPPLPIVTIVATTPNATEAGPVSGAFTLSRTGSTAGGLTVRYSVGGTAVNGSDYATLSGTASFPAGSPSTIVTVLPVDDALQEGNETVVLTLTDDPAYTVGSPGSATVTIVDNEEPPSLPSRVLNLVEWKLTLPVDTSHAGSPDEIKQPELNGYQNTNFFLVNPSRDGVLFIAPCGGATTSGSSYPRSELREMASSGRTEASWSTTSGRHTMEIRQAITHLPVAKPHVVAGQIHDASDDVIVFRLEGSKLFVDENGANGPVLTSNYHLGDVFTVKFIAHDGGIECYYNGTYIYTYPKSTSTCYFKAGCYTQSNTSRGDQPTAFGAVTIFNVTVTHE